MRTQNLQRQKTLRKSVTTRLQTGYLGYASSLSCARRRRAISYVAQCRPKKCNNACFQKVWNPARRNFFLLAYCYRKIFGAQSGLKFCLPTAPGKSLEPSKTQNFAYLLLPENFWSPVKAQNFCLPTATGKFLQPVKPKILLTYCYRKIFGAQQRPKILLTYCYRKIFAAH